MVIRVNGGKPLDAGHSVAQSITMSTETPPKRRKVTVPALRARKNGEPIVCLTAYTAPMAKLLDPHVDLLLVGDSLGMVLYGFDSTLPVTLDMMIAHGAAVVRGANKSCVIVDLPFGSYQKSPEQAYVSSARVMKETGCAGVKLEGGVEMAETVAFLTSRGIPVLGHIGLQPQSVNTYGGYGPRGRQDTAKRLHEDAKALSEAGAFGVVLEAVIEPLAADITKRIPIPTIGIGASASCDGQILVTEDVLGLFSEFKPRFVKRYAELGPQIDAAVSDYAHEVKERRFPGPEHTFSAENKK